MQISQMMLYADLIPTSSAFNTKHILVLMTRCWEISLESRCNVKNACLFPVEDFHDFMGHLHGELGSAWYVKINE